MDSFHSLLKQLWYLDAVLFSSPEALNENICKKWLDNTLLRRLVAGHNNINVI
jgi:hypothetical protein